MTPDRFRQIVTEVLDRLPRRFRERLENVAVVVETEPTAEQLEAAGLEPETDTLFGLYEGVALPERSYDYAGLPDRIVLFAGPLTRHFRSERALRREIRITLVHEIGHHFGFDEEALEKLGYR